MEAHEFKPGDAARLPFNQPSGSQAAALGPVIKRSGPSKVKEAGPSVKIQQTTLKAFEEIAGAGKPWSDFFRSARECFLLPKIQVKGQILEVPEGAFQAAIRVIEEKRTVVLAFQDLQERLPGEVREYVDYLKEVLAETKYSTRQAPPQDAKTCALCGDNPVVVYPNALRGAGINLANLDRVGAFPGLDASVAWKAFALCLACADLMYVYWNHVAEQFRTTVAGYPALIIPALQLDPEARRRFVKRLREWVKEAAAQKDALAVREKQLLNILGEQQAVATLTILWAEFGQRIDDVRGMVTDILPSRLQQLAGFNQHMNGLQSPVFPEWPLEDFEYNLPVTILKSLLKRPGGKAAQNSNESRRLFDLRRDLAEAIYHTSPLPERFWLEVHETARWHWEQVCDSGSPWGLLHEGRTKDGRTFLTAAGWVRQLARFLYFLGLVGVTRMPETTELYQPRCEALKPYCGPGTAIVGPRKAFAFILGGSVRQAHSDPGGAWGQRRQQCSDLAQTPHAFRNRFARTVRQGPRKTDALRG